MVVKYKGQKLRYVKDFHGKEVLWILNPEQIEMPGMIFVGGYPNEQRAMWGMCVLTWYVYGMLGMLPPTFGCGRSGNIKNRNDI